MRLLSIWRSVNRWTSVSPQATTAGHDAPSSTAPLYLLPAWSSWPGRRGHEVISHRQPPGTSAVPNEARLLVPELYRKRICGHERPRVARVTLYPRQFRGTRIKLGQRAAQATATRARRLCISLLDGASVDRTRTHSYPLLVPPTRTPPGPTLPGVRWPYRRPTWVDRLIGDLIGMADRGLDHLLARIPNDDQE